MVRFVIEVLICAVIFAVGHVVQERMFGIDLTLFQEAAVGVPWALTAVIVWGVGKR